MTDMSDNLPKNALIEPPQDLLQGNPYHFHRTGNPASCTIKRSGILQKIQAFLNDPSSRTCILHAPPGTGLRTLSEDLVRKNGISTPFFPVALDLESVSDRTQAGSLGLLSWTVFDRIPLTEPDKKHALDLLQRSKFQEFFQFVGRQAGHPLLLLINDLPATWIQSHPRTISEASVLPFLYDKWITQSQDNVKLILLSHLAIDAFNLLHPGFPKEHWTRVPFLDYPETRELISLSIRNRTLPWSEDAMSFVYALTQGHPLLVQALCHSIWNRRFQTGIPFNEQAPVGINELEQEVPLALDLISPSLQFWWNGLAPGERILATILSDMPPVFASSETIQKAILEKELPQPELLQQQIDLDLLSLAQSGLVEVRNGSYRFHIEMFRRWLNSFRPDQFFLQALDELIPAAYHLYQAANQGPEHLPLQTQHHLLQSALSLNPNLSGALHLLASLPEVEAVDIPPASAPASPNDTHQPLSQVSAPVPRKKWQELAQNYLKRGEVISALDLFAANGAREEGVRIGLDEIERLEASNRSRESVHLAGYLHKKFPKEMWAIEESFSKEPTQPESNPTASHAEESTLPTKQPQISKDPNQILVRIKAKRRPSPAQPPVPIHAPSTSTPPVPRLHSWNPADYLRILNWMLNDPSRLETHNSYYGQETSHLMGKRVVLFSTWMPLFLPLFALGIGRLPSLENHWHPLTYLWMSALVWLGWLATDWFESSRFSKSGRLNEVSIASGVIAGSAGGATTFFCHSFIQGPLPTQILIILGAVVTLTSSMISGGLPRSFAHLFIRAFATLFAGVLTGVACFANILPTYWSLIFQVLALVTMSIAVGAAKGIVFGLSRVSGRVISAVLGVILAVTITKTLHVMMDISLSKTISLALSSFIGMTFAGLLSYSIGSGFTKFAESLLNSNPRFFAHSSFVFTILSFCALAILCLIGLKP